MFLLFGIGSGQKVMGVFAGIPCFFCGARHSMTITKHYSYFQLFFIPLIRYNVVYYAACPDCSAVYVIEKHKAAQLCRDPNTVINTSDMVTVHRGLGVCPACGANVRPEDAYCPKCGRKLS